MEANNSYKKVCRINVLHYYPKAEEYYYFLSSRFIVQTLLCVLKSKSHVDIIDFIVYFDASGLKIMHLR